VRPAPHYLATYDCGVTVRVQACKLMGIDVEVWGQTGEIRCPLRLQEAQRLTEALREAIEWITS
jgi:hypothetical protein